MTHQDNMSTDRRFFYICLVDGGWSEWSNGPCSVSCEGVGTMTVTRSCSNPAPAYGGLNCEGESEQTGLECGPIPCPSKR